MSTTGLERFNKKFGSAVKRTKKEAKKAAEGHMLKEMADKKAATMSTEEKAMKYFKENNITVPEDEQYTIMTMSFYNKMEADMKANITAELKTKMEKEDAEMNAELIKTMAKEMATEMIKEMNKARNTELALQIKLQEAQNEALRMQLELAHLAMEKHLEGKVEEVQEAVNQVEEQFEEKPKRAVRKAKANKVILGKAPEMCVDYTPINKGRGGYSIAWKKVHESGKFMDVLYSVVLFAIDNEVDVTDTNAFRKFHPVCQGAYMQYTKLNAGNKGCWKALMMEYGVIVG
jgi:hypothetical protein